MIAEKLDDSSGSPTIVIFQRALAILTLTVALIALTALTGWFVGHIILARFFPEYPPLRITGCLVILPLTAAVYLKFTGRRKHSLWLNALSLSLLILSLLFPGIESALRALAGWTGSSLNAAPVSLAPQGSICAVLLIFSLFLPVQPKKTWQLHLSFMLPLIALGTSSAAGIGFICHIEAAYFWAKFTPIAIPAALTFFLLSVATIWGTLINLKTFNSEQTAYLPATTFVALAATTVLVWWGLHQQAQKVIRDETRSHGESVARRLEDNFTGLVRSFEHTAKMWNSAKSSPRKLWKRALDIKDDNDKNIRHLSWASADGKTLLTDLKAEEAQAFQHLNLIQTSSREEKEPRLALHLNKADGAILLSVPTFSKGKHSGTLFTAIDSRQFVKRLTEDGDFDILIALDDLSAAPFENTRLKSAVPAKSEILVSEIYGIKWQIALRSKPAHSLPNTTSNSNLLLILGLFISGCISTLINFILRERAQVSRLAELVAGKTRQLQTVLDNIPQIAWEFDTRAPIDSLNASYINERWFSYTGLPTRQELLPHALRPEHRTQYLERFKNSLQSGQAFEREIELRAASGEYRWFLSRAVPLKTTDDIPTRWFGTLTDIHDFKLTQQRSQEQSQVQRLALQAASMGTFHYDSETREFRWSPELELLYGKAPGALGKTRSAWEDQILPEDLAQVRACFDSTFFSTTTTEAEWRIQNPDGQIRWLTGRFQSVRDENGKVTRIVGVQLDTTARRTLEDEYKKFHALAESSVEFIGMCDVNFQPYYGNPAAMRLVGLDDLKQTLQTHVKEFFFPEDQDAILNDFFPRVIRQGQAEIEVRFRHFKTGKAIWVLYNVVNLKDEKGKLIGWATVSRDITARKQAEHHLKLSERKFRAIFEQAAVGIAQIGLDGQWLAVNSKLSAILGYSETEILSIDMRDITHPNDLRLDIINTADLLSGKTATYSIEKRFIKKNSEVVWTNFAVSLVRDEKEMPLYFICVIEDISERKAALKELQDLRFALDQTSIVETSAASGQILSANDKFCSVMNFSREELVGKSHRVLNSGKHSREFFMEMWHTISSGKIWRGEIQNRTKDGRDVWLDTIIVPFMDSSGIPYQFIAIRNDTTERRRSEEERAQLRIREQVALNSGKIKDDFLAHMSHEIRTPINGIIGMTSLLEDTALNEDQRGILQGIIHSSEHLSALINDILDLSKVESGKLELEIEVFDLSSFVEELCKWSEAQTTVKGLRFKKGIGIEKGTYVRGDSTRIRQILMNLIHNAIKFTPSGELSLMVYYHSRGQHLSAVHFDVLDSGIGIAPEQLDKIFDRFTQADTSTSRRFGGTGLGLPICQSLAKLMGGRISVASRVNAGSKFSLQLTLANAEEPKDHTTRTAQLYSLPKDQRAKMRILVADDNTINVDITVRLLKQAGYKADAVGNGVEALEAASALPYDLILMDCEMPEMDGYEATKAIRALGFTKPIVALTAHAYSRYRARAFASGMTDFISKPIRAPALISSVDKWLGGILTDIATDSTNQETDAGPSREFDATVIGNLRQLETESGEVILSKVIDNFQLLSKEALAELQLFSREVDEVKLQKTAHRLKSSSANLGLLKVTKICDQLENGNFTHTVETELPPLIAELETAVKSANQHLRGLHY